MLFFFTSVPFSYDAKMKPKELLGNHHHNGSAEKNCVTRLDFPSSIHSFYDLLQKIGTLRGTLHQEKRSGEPTVHSCGHKFKSSS